ncbi:hypothetical protein B0H17DRAFT_1211917 [Mycena rosella]|uniref:CBM1 domain-containing protein n=1 Tax=Mycena rosella TaxID=1033263 RepID=A0AAD7CU76_MYCRO|nr:hypothetical protein B0H17DRAFT_1211917 [Mycena rosella]
MVSTSSTPTTVWITTTPTGGVAAHWDQCSGMDWTGPTVCAAPYTCKAANTYYSQCL